MLLWRFPSVAFAISFLCRPIKFSSSFDPIKLQKRESKTSEVLLISLGLRSEEGRSHKERPASLSM